MDSNPGPAPAIEIADLHLTLESDAGPVAVLRGIDLNVAQGETLGIIGPSGSGKTSLLMVIAGLEAATNGRVRVGGHALGELDEDGLARFRRDNVGIVFQSFHLVPTMSALENAALPLEFAGRADAFERAAEALTEVGLGERLGHYPGQLSGGEQQRVALARAFVSEPAILLADEPTGSLDQATGEAVMAALFRLQERRRTTLVLVTHAPELAHRCRRILHIADGRVAADEITRA
ncbi:MAG: ABC transporter ATP-binding protein [Rhodospirillaceae bacterium]|jgi:putative ABC transport system ATP-binding protein